MPARRHLRLPLRRPLARPLGRRGAPPAALPAALLTLALWGAACSSAGSDAPVEPATESLGRIVELPQTEDGEPIPLEPAGVVVNKYDLDPGSCFNRYSTLDETGGTTEETRVVDCSEPHEGEVYLQLPYPAGAGEPYPGVSAMIGWTEQQCYDAFEDFVGLQYELSGLEIGTMQPTVETWTGAGLHREVTCYVYSYTGNALQGSMEGSGV